MSRPGLLGEEFTAFQVLLWVPYTELGECKQVCRAWKAVIESAAFWREWIRLHGEPCVILRERIFFPSAAAIEEEADEGRKSRRPAVQLQMSDKFRMYHSKAAAATAQASLPPGSEVIASSKGLVLCIISNRLYVCNPMTRESRRLPDPPLNTLSSFWAYLWDGSVDMFVTGGAAEMRSCSYRIVAATLSEMLSYDSRSGAWEMSSPVCNGLEEKDCSAKELVRDCSSPDTQFVAAWSTHDITRAYDWKMVFGAYDLHTNTWKKVRLSRPEGVQGYKNHRFFAYRGKYMLGVLTHEAFLLYELTTKNAKWRLKWRYRVFSYHSWWSFIDYPRDGPAGCHRCLVVDDYLVWRVPYYEADQLWRFDGRYDGLRESTVDHGHATAAQVMCSLIDGRRQVFQARDRRLPPPPSPYSKLDVELVGAFTPSPASP